MNNIIYILVLSLFLIDMFLTYRYVKAYKNMYPKSAWWLSEANPILKIFMKIQGLELGLLSGATIIFFILTISLGYLPDYYGTFLLGVYFMTNTYHFVNWRALKRLKNQKEIKNKWKENINII